MATSDVNPTEASKQKWRSAVKNVTKERQRKVVTDAHEIGKLTYPEIADILGVTKLRVMQIVKEVRIEREEAPMAEPHILGQTPPEPEAEFPEGTNPELIPQLREMNNLLRGNQRIEQQLMQKGQRVDPGLVMMMRVEHLINVILGAPQESQERIDFEKSFGEQMASILSQALIQAP